MIHYHSKGKGNMEGKGRLQVEQRLAASSRASIKIKIETQALTAPSASRFLLHLFVCCMKSEFLADFQNFPPPIAEEGSFSISRVF